MERRTKLIAVALVLVLAVGGLLWTLRPAPVPVEVVTVAPSTMARTIQEPGVVRVRKLRTIASPAAGRIVRSPLSVGDAVKKGQRMAVIFSERSWRRHLRWRAKAKRWLNHLAEAEREAAVRAGNAWQALSAARHSYVGLLMQRQWGRGDENVVRASRSVARAKRDELTLAVSEVRAARKARRRFQEAMRREKLRSAARRMIAIRAPIDGLVLEARPKGQSIRPGQPLFKVGSLDRLEAVVEIPSEDAARLNPGTAVTLQAGGGSTLVEGRVRRVDRAREEPRVRVRVDFERDDPAARRLGPGNRVSAKLKVWEKSNVLAVPPSALVRDVDRWAVYRLEGKKVSLQPVTLGEWTPKSVQIVAGLDAGAQVVASPNGQLKSGTRVEPRALPGEAVSGLNSSEPLTRR